MDDISKSENGQQTEKSKGWGMYPNWVINSGAWSRLLPTERAIFGVLVVKAYYPTHICQPTVETLSALSGVAKSSISGATKGLVEKGLIKKWRNGNREKYKVIFEPEAWVYWNVHEDKDPKESETYLRDTSTGRFKPRNTDSIRPKESEPGDPSESDAA